MDLPDSTVLASLAGLVTGGLALARARQRSSDEADAAERDARTRVYADTRRDLDDCKTRGARLESQVETLSSHVAECQAHHREGLVERERLRARIEEMAAGERVCEEQHEAERAAVRALTARLEAMERRTLPAPPEEE